MRLCYPNRLFPAKPVRCTNEKKLAAPQINAMAETIFLADSSDRYVICSVVEGGMTPGDYGLLCRRSHGKG